VPAQLHALGSRLPSLPPFRKRPAGRIAAVGWAKMRASGWLTSSAPAGWSRFLIASFPAGAGARRSDLPTARCPGDGSSRKGVLHSVTFCKPASHLPGTDPPDAFPDFRGGCGGFCHTHIVLKTSTAGRPWFEPRCTKSAGCPCQWKPRWPRPSKTKLHRFCVTFASPKRKCPRHLDSACPPAHARLASKTRTTPHPSHTVALALWTFDFVVRGPVVP
jgi:hypothetical protein